MPGRKSRSSTLRGLAVLAAGLPLVAAGCAQSGGISVLGDILQASGLGAVRPLDNPTIVSGLKEALRVGARNAVRLTSSTGGFLDNERIRIALPGQLDTMARALRTVGFGKQVDELEVAMNRAAERGAAEAAGVFVDTITRMSFDDARSILQGGDTAATDYFRRTTSKTLRDKFAPIVREKMDQVGVARQYNALVDRVAAIPFVSAPSLSLDTYVTDQALRGLFTTLGDEEKKIRNNPAARVTPLLKRVFGR